MTTLPGNENELCTFLNWDSDFFGLRIGRVNSQRLENAQMHAALNWCRENAINCLYFMADAGDPATIRLAEEHGFRLCEVRLTYERDLKEWQPQPVPRQYGDVLIRQATAQDVPALQEIAKKAYTTTHYVTDPFFPQEKVEEFYATWINNSVLEGFDDMVLVAEAQFEDSTPDEVIAFITARLLAEPDGSQAAPGQRKSHIPLIGVKAGLRKKGVGMELIRAMFDWLVQNGACHTIGVCQAANPPVRRIIERLGFLSISAHLYYHKWLQPSDS